MTKHYEPANGRCVCHLHRQFEAENGFTVDQWYERNPEVTPWYMERCSGCTEEVKPTIQATQQTSAVPSVANVQATQHETGGTHFASFPDSPIPTYQEIDTMCETRQEAIETNCPCLAHQVEDQLLKGMIKATAALATLAVCGALVVTASAFIAVWAAVTASAWLTWKFRRPLQAVIVGLATVATAPLRLSAQLVAEGVEAMRADQERKKAVSLNPLTNTQAYRVVEPLQLTADLQPMSFDFAQREPVYASAPARSTVKTSAKMEAK